MLFALKKKLLMLISINAKTKLKLLTLNSLKNTMKKLDYTKPYTKTSTRESKLTRSSSTLPCRPTFPKPQKKISDNSSPYSRKKNHFSNPSLMKTTKSSTDLKKPPTPFSDSMDSMNPSNLKKREDKTSIQTLKSFKNLKLKKIINLRL